MACGCELGSSSSNRWCLRAISQCPRVLSAHHFRCELSSAWTLGLPTPPTASLVPRVRAKLEMSVLPEVPEAAPMYRGQTEDQVIGNVSYVIELQETNLQRSRE
eukprot:1215935-Pyramimonas_sp.AAC.1